MGHWAQISHVVSRQSTLKGNNERVYAYIGTVGTLVRQQDKPGMVRLASRQLISHVTNRLPTPMAEEHDLFGHWYKLAQPEVPFCLHNLSRGLG